MKRTLWTLLAVSTPLSLFGSLLWAQPPRLRLGQRNSAPVQQKAQPPKPADAQPTAKPTSDPPINVATEEEKNQKIAPDWNNPWLVFYLTGNQTGYLEPCGCTGLANQKGGINRKDTLLTSLVNRGWQVMALDAGDQVRRDGTQSEIKFNWTAQAFRQMGYAASTYGAKDLLLSDNILVSILDENGKNNLFVSANVSMRPDEDLRYRVLSVQGPDKKPRKIGITGVLGEETLRAQGQNKQDFFSISPAIPALQEVAQKLRE